jgi:hypothetical protein
VQHFFSDERVNEAAHNVYVAFKVVLGDSPFVLYLSHSFLRKIFFRERRHAG